MWLIPALFPQGGSDWSFQRFLMIATERPKRRGIAQGAAVHQTVGPATIETGHSVSEDRL